MLQRYQKVLILLSTYIASLAMTKTTNVVKKNPINCKAFSKYSDFNPIYVMNQKWYLLCYLFDEPIKSKYYVFKFLTGKDIKILDHIFHYTDPKPVNYSTATMFIEDDRSRIALLIPEREEGEYSSYLLHPGKVDENAIKVDEFGYGFARRRRDLSTLLTDYADDDIPREITLKKSSVRIKQVDNGKMLAFLDCNVNKLLMMTKSANAGPEYRDSRGRSISQIVKGMFVDDEDITEPNYPHM